MFTKQYFIDKFTAIPDERWTTNSLEYKGACCALGHCGVRDWIPTDESRALIALFTTLNLRYNEDDHMLTEEPVWRVNDTNVRGRYPQATPKARILAALNDIKENDNAV